MVLTTSLSNLVTTAELCGLALSYVSTKLGLTRAENWTELRAFVKLNHKCNV